ncbi:hypothetical protein SynA1825c_02099 [Synechococcus sp. A18-25c]|nr:hypothetical protein SynA1825c_02099 [Synechococcus sp. A18-25c]
MAAPSANPTTGCTPAIDHVLGPDFKPLRVRSFDCVGSSLHQHNHGSSAEINIEAINNTLNERVNH